MGQPISKNQSQEKEKFLFLLLSKEIYWKRENQNKVNRLKTKYNNKPSFKEFTKTLSYQNNDICPENVNFHI
jgi:hypothetical protein